MIIKTVLLFSLFLTATTVFSRVNGDGNATTEMPKSSNGDGNTTTEMPKSGDGDGNTTTEMPKSGDGNGNILQEILGSLFKGTNGTGMNIQSLLSGFLSGGSSNSSQPTDLQSLLGRLFSGVGANSSNVSNLSDLLGGLLSGRGSGNNSNVSNLSDLLGGLLSGGGSGNNNVQKQLASLLGGLGGNNTDINNMLEQLMSNPALVGTFLSTVTGTIKISESCITDITTMVQGARAQELWSLYMLDAFGKPEAMLLEGNVNWVGSYGECVAIQERVVSEDQKPARVTGHYCPITLNGLVPEQLKAAGVTGITIGSCFPNTCGNQDISSIVTAVQTLLNVAKPVEASVDCKSESKKIRGDAIVVIVILTIFALFMILGTLYDVLAVQLPSGKQNDSVVVENGNKNNAYLKSFTNGAFNGPVEGKDEKSVEMSKIQLQVQVNSTAPIQTPAVDHKQMEAKEHSTLEKLLLSFSVYSNGVKILSPKQSGSLGALNGIRVLSMGWVILGHTYFFAIFIELSSNGGKDFFRRYLEEWTFTGVGNASFAVDTFFALSGTLVAYFTLQELKKARGVKRFKWIMFYVHRYWRLTPAYMLVIMVGTVLLPYLVSGPLVQTGYDLTFMDPCRRNWWTNLLYVNNYVNAKDMCMGWSWYLANDMQFYIISPLLLVPLFYSTVAGLVSCIIFLAATITAVAMITYRHGYPAQTLLAQFGALPMSDDNYDVLIYFPSFSRMGPYIIGIFTGYILYKWKCKCRIPKVINLGCWLLAFCSSCAIIYGVYTHHDSHYFTETESVIYMSVSRTAWGIVVCWVMFACATGHGGWINEVLSWKPFVPLARLTYAAYLIHPLVMMVFYYSRDQMTYFSNYETIYLFLGHFCLSYGVGFLVSLAFEAPMMGIEKALMKRGR